jgi:uncharacterized protein (TIGR02145 family)
MRNTTTFIRQLGLMASSETGGYGRLYNWYAVGDANFTPSGWHMPTDTEWTTLTTYLGGESVAGGKLKEVGYTHWVNPNEGATNESGFTALPGGYRDYDGTFGYVWEFGNWWSSTEVNTTYAYFRALYYFDSNVYRNYADKEVGVSVRCLRPVSFYGALYNWYAVNDARNIAPVGCHIPTRAESNLLGVNLGGNSIAGGKMKEDMFINWYTNNYGATNESGFLALPTGYRAYGSFGAGRGSLVEVGYYWNIDIYVTTNPGFFGVEYSSTALRQSGWPKSFGLGIRCICDTAAETVTDYDGNIYDVIQIGTQRWLTQDLKTTRYQNGDYINGWNTTYTGSAWDALTVGAMCYYNNAAAPPTANQPTTLTDCDGNIYDVVQIGRQLWIKQNYKCTHLNNGIEIPEITNNTTWAGLTSGAWCYYNNDPSNL